MSKMNSLGPESAPETVPETVPETAPGGGRGPGRGELRFKSLNLVELVLGDALLVNSRCLRFLAQHRARRSLALGSAQPPIASRGAEMVLSDQEMLSLRRCVTRLSSHWCMLAGTSAGSLAKAARSRLKLIEALIPPGSATGRAAKELLEQSPDPKRRAALREVMDHWVINKRVRQVSAIDRDRLLELLEQDASAWQEAVDQVGSEETEALFAVLKASYKKSRRQCRQLGKSKEYRQLGEHQLERLLRQVGRNVAQLELLRPGLSDDYAKQLWYLQRLERNLRRRLDLLAFEQRLFAMDLRSDRLLRVQQRAQQAVQARALTQAQRTEKLRSLAYQRKPKAYLDGIVNDLAAPGRPPLTLADSHLDTLSAATAFRDTNHLGEITVEEPDHR